MIRRPPISTLFPTRRSSDLRRLIGREPAIRVGEPRPQGLEHPRLRLDSRFGDLDSSDRSARIETDGELEWAVLAIHSHENQRAGDLLLMLPDVESDHPVGRLPTNRVVDTAGIAAAEMHFPRRELIRAGQEVVNGILPFDEYDSRCDMQQRGHDRAEYERLHGFLHHI